jgi:2-polyprenyl-6-hydroxyphenyl methylase/3-demethylubiquinone-9 3-methyltransferase
VIGFQDSFDQLGCPPTVESLWELMDVAWRSCGCSQWRYDPKRYSAFYSHFVWELNGLFVDHDPESLRHREIFAHAIASRRPKKILDYGGGHGTLARLIADQCPEAIVELFDPYAVSRSAKSFDRVETLEENSFDVIVATDVLEHVHDPLRLLWKWSGLLAPGGWLLLANCFEPVVLCHLPKTFYLSFSLPVFARAFGLQYISPVGETHAIWLQKVASASPCWPWLRLQEVWSQLLYPYRRFWQRWGAALRRRLPWG